MSFGDVPEAGKAYENQDYCPSVISVVIIPDFYAYFGAMTMMAV
jgi:hypothetical protein